MIQAEIIDWLLSRESITDKVNDRIYPVKLPQRISFPAVCYTRISNMRFATHSGQSDLKRVRLQFSVYSKTYTDAVLISREIKDALHCFKGNMGNLQVGAAFLESENDSYDYDSNLYHIPVDVYITYKSKEYDINVYVVDDEGNKIIHNDNYVVQ